MISEEEKAEAKGHGIVPGAVIYCAADPYSYGTVAPYSEWETGGDPPFLIVGIDDEGGDLFALYGYDWATVRTPAPQQGLQPRDACKCSPAMQAAIAEKADELGLWSGCYYSGHDGFWVVDSGPNKGKVRPAFFSSNPTRTLNFLTPAQFLTRLEHTSPPVNERTTEQKLEEATGQTMILVIYELAPGMNKLKRMHWAVYKKTRDKWQTLVRSQAGTRKVSGPCTVQITRYQSGTQLDPDNLVSSAKIPLDALVRSKVIEDDSSEHITLSVTAIRIKSRKDQRTEIVISA